MLKSLFVARNAGALAIAAVLVAGCGQGATVVQTLPYTPSASSIPAPNASPAAALPGPLPPAGVTAVVDDYVNERTANTPGVGVLAQFNKLWMPGSAYSNGTVLNQAVLSQNVAYTASVDAARTPAEEVAAYYDDRRNQSYSVIDGLGPLTNTYLVGSGATTTIPSAFNATMLATTEYDDAGTGNAGGVLTSPLGTVVTLVNNVRSFSTTPAKNAYNYPRPFRLNSQSVVQDTGATQTINATIVSGASTTTATRVYPVYNSPVAVAPSLVVDRSTTPASDGAFPSGHTNASLLAALAIGYAIPERFQEMLTRASELGNSRILAGMHDPLDVMGGRIAATSWAAAILYNNDMSNTASPVITKQSAYTNTHNYLFAQTGTTANTLFAYAHQANLNVDRFADYGTNRVNYLQHLTYGFPQINSTTVGPLVPKGAEVLLETRQPYMTADQRRWALASTELPSGYPLLDDAEGWGRLNLFAAADGMATLTGNVFVTMDATQGGFNASDLWRNNIGGSGTLYKRGTGTLLMSGNNTFTGGVQVDAGTLEATSQNALGAGNVILNGGTLLISSSAPVNVPGYFNEPAGSTLQLMIGPNGQGTMVLDGLAAFSGALSVSFTSGFTPVAGTTYSLITTNAAYFGSFSGITVNGTILPYTASFTSTGLQLKF